MNLRPLDKEFNQIRKRVKMSGLRHSSERSQIESLAEPIFDESCRALGARCFVSEDDYFPRFLLALSDGRSFSAPLPFLCRPRPRLPALVNPRSARP